jgi:hypothetical protein
MHAARRRPEAEPGKARLGIPEVADEDDDVIKTQDVLHVGCSHCHRSPSGMIGPAPGPFPNERPTERKARCSGDSRSSTGAL